MKFSVGDKVVLKENGKEVIVISVINSKVLEVETNDGKAITVLANDVKHPVPNKTQLIGINKAEKSSRMPNTASKKQMTNGFYFSFQPVFTFDKEAIESLELSFLNRSKFAVVLQYSFSTLNTKTNRREIIVPAFEKSMLGSVLLEQMNGYPKFYYQISSLKEEVSGSSGNWLQYSGHVGLPPKRLFDLIQKMTEQKEDSFEIQLSELKELPVLKEKIVPVSQKKVVKQERHSTRSSYRKNAKSSFEIDLHTETLNIPIGRLNNFEILTIQLKSLEKAIDKALSQNQTSLIIIHGVGNGKLKEEVHQLLRRHSQVSFFQYSWRPNYGWGATEAFFK